MPRVKFNVPRGGDCYYHNRKNKPPCQYVESNRIEPRCKFWDTPLYAFKNHKCVDALRFLREANDWPNAITILPAPAKRLAERPQATTPVADDETADALHKGEGA